MTEAIRFVLAEHGFRAGAYRVGYLSCDDSTAQAGGTDVAKCRANAAAYVADQAVLGIIGAYDSSCTGVELPTTSAAKGGPLAMISPSNTYVGLTRAGPGTPRGELGSFYPKGERNFVRIIGADNAQGAADAMLAKQLDARRVFALDDGESYGIGVAACFKRAARRLGLVVAGTAAWQPSNDRFDALAREIQHSGATAVFLGGLLYSPSGTPTGGSLIRALRRVLGPRTLIIASDGFLPIADVRAAADSAANGLYVSVNGEPNADLGAAGQRFLKSFAATQPHRLVVSYAATYGAQAAEVLLGAIAASNGTRASVTERLRAARIHDGILGSFSFDRTGDIVPAPVTIFRIDPRIGGNSTLLTDFTGAAIDRVIAPPRSLSR
jgi:branched-chain amino acid transport system substrate-binding protein